MSNFKKYAMAGALACVAVTSASAADLLPPPPPPVPIVVSGWYLRGDIGMTNQQTNSLTDYVAPGTAVGTKFLTFDSAPLYSLGGGYQFASWLRADVTGEYRGNAHFHGQQVAQFGTVILPDDYTASKSEWLFLANGYVDLGTWWHVTPFIGAGIGTSRNTISSFTDIGATQVGTTILSTTYGENASKWQLAYAAYAGLAYEVAPGFAVELSYRYVNLGKAATGPTNSFDGITVVNGPGFNFGTLTSQDVMLGFRWSLGEPIAPLPIITKG